VNPDDTMRTEWALVQLNNAFAYYRDNGPVESMMELFTEDARIERAGTALRGHQELRDFLQERAKNTTRHLLTTFTSPTWTRTPPPVLSAHWCTRVPLRKSVDRLFRAPDESSSSTTPM
jgi:hypothetical protein